MTDTFRTAIMAMLTAGLICPPLRCKLHIARVAMLSPKHKEISSVDGGCIGFHVMVVPVVRKMKKKVAISSIRALAQKWRLFSSDVSIIVADLLSCSAWNRVQLKMLYVTIWQRFRGLGLLYVCWYACVLSNLLLWKLGTNSGIERTRKCQTTSTRKSGILNLYVISVPEIKKKLSKTHLKVTKNTFEGLH